MSKKNSIGDVLAATLGGGHFVDIDNMGDDEITERVLRLKVDAGSAILEIGRWLTVMKSRKEHGAWLAWLERVDIHDRAARRYMQLYEGYSSNRTALSDLGPTKALTLLALPEPERDAFVEAHDVRNMSTRELDDAIKRQKELEQERDEALKDAEAARAEAKTAEESRAKMERDMTVLSELQAIDRDAADKLRERIKELETHKDVYQDEDAIKKAADEARAAAIKEMQREVDKARDETARVLAEARKTTSVSDGHKCVTGLNPHGNCGSASYCNKPYSCCIACDDPCNSQYGFLPELKAQESILPPVAPIVTPTWYTGTPPGSGLYYCEFDCDGDLIWQIVRFDALAQDWVFPHGAKIDAVCRHWWPLPEE